MGWLILIVVGIAGLLFVAARQGWRQGQQEMAANLIAMAESNSAALTTKEAQDTFKTHMRHASDIELRQALVEGMRAEIEGENAEQIFAEQGDTEMLASTRADLRQVRIRLGWVREECASRGVAV